MRRYSWLGLMVLGLLAAGLLVVPLSGVRADEPLRVLVLVAGQNIDEETQLAESILAEEIAARGYLVQDRAAVDWAAVRSKLSGRGPREGDPWVKGLRDKYDFLLAGEAKARRGHTPQALQKAGLVSVQARIQLRLYDVQQGATITTTNKQGAGAHLDAYTAGEKALETALQGVAEELFGERPALPVVAIKDAAAARTEVPAAEPQITICPDLVDDLPQREGQNPDAFAVVIGNSHYLKTKNVDFALNDAHLVQLYLMRVLGFKAGNIFLVQDATKADFELYFGSSDNHRGKLFNAVKPHQSDVFIYYAGHGAPGIKDKTGFFVPVDADPNYVEIQGYSTRVFYRNLEQLPARSITVVLDACFSGANYEGISPVGISFENPVMNLPNAVVFSSSKGTQVSSWYDEKKHGLFTYMFAAGIHHLAADANHDGQLTYEELFRFITDGSQGVPYYARLLHNVEQTPTKIQTLPAQVFIQK